NGARTTNGNIALLMPQKVVHRYRERFSKKEKILHRAELLADTDYTILQRYQAVLRGVYNFYCAAINVGRRMQKIKWILETSLTKTLAHKHKCSVTEIYKRHQVSILDSKMLRVIVPRQDKEPLVSVFGGISFKRIPNGMGPADTGFETKWFAAGGQRSEVVQRLLAEKCELCGAEGPTEVHHIRKLADIDRPGRRPKATWEKIMSARKRKTLVVCGDCHDAITFGKHDGPTI